MEWLKEQLAPLAGTRWVVVAGCCAAAGTMTAALVAGSPVVAAFFLALAANGAVMGLAGISRQIWHGAEVSEAQVGGAGLTLDAAQSVQQGLSDLNKRVDAHTETVNKRLYDLEKHAFKGSAEGNDEQE
jgi:hypothetical protein